MSRRVAPVPNRVSVAEQNRVSVAEQNRVSVAEQNRVSVAEQNRVSVAEQHEPPARYRERVSVLEALASHLYWE